MRRILVPFSIVGAMLVLQSPIQAQTDDSDLPVSIERIRAALKHGRALQIPAQSGDTPTFRIKLQGHFPFCSPLTTSRRSTYGLPSVGERLMGGVQKIGSAVVDYSAVALSVGHGRRWTMPSRRSAPCTSAQRLTQASNGRINQRYDRAPLIPPFQLNPRSRAALRNHPSR